MLARIVVALLAAVALLAGSAAADGSAFKRCHAVVRDGVRNPVRAKRGDIRGLRLATVIDNVHCNS